MNEKYAYHDNEPVKLTERFILAVEEFLRADLDMMRQTVEPHLAECWQWGICEIRDLTQYPKFEYGGNEDRPSDLPDEHDVFIRLPNQEKLRGLYEFKQAFVEDETPP